MVKSSIIPYYPWRGLKYMSKLSTPVFVDSKQHAAAAELYVMLVAWHLRNKMGSLGAA